MNGSFLNKHSNLFKLLNNLLKRIGTVREGYLLCMRDSNVCVTSTHQAISADLTVLTQN